MAKKKNESAPEKEPELEIDPQAETDTEPETEAPDENEQRIAALEEALSAEKEKCLRLAAEYDNFRKRSAKEREAIFTDVRAETIIKLLPVYDNLERALKQETADEAYQKGVDMTMTQLKEIFTALGVTEIPAQSETFDPNLHNAVMHVDDEELGESVIVEEFQKGFKLGDRVIRFSLVKVAN